MHTQPKVLVLHYLYHKALFMLLYCPKVSSGKHTINSAETLTCDGHFDVHFTLCRTADTLEKISELQVVHVVHSVETAGSY